jgi:hypothetical protein
VIDRKTRQLSSSSLSEYQFPYLTQFRFDHWGVNRDMTALAARGERRDYSVRDGSGGCGPVISAIDLSRRVMESFEVTPRTPSRHRPLTFCLSHTRRIEITGLPRSPALLQSSCVVSPVFLSLGDGVLRLGYWGMVGAANTHTHPTNWLYSVNGLEIDAVTGQVVRHVSAPSSPLPLDFSPGSLAEIIPVDRDLWLAFSYRGPELMVSANGRAHCVSSPAFFTKVRSLYPPSVSIYYCDVFTFEGEERVMVFLVAERPTDAPFRGHRFVLARVQGGAQSGAQIVFLSSCPAGFDIRMGDRWWAGAGREWWYRKRRGIMYRDEVSFVLAIGGGRSCVVEIETPMGGSIRDSTCAITSRVVDGYCIAPRKAGTTSPDPGWQTFVTEVLAEQERRVMW